MSNAIISVEGIGKEYRLGASMSSDMLREQIANTVRRLLGRTPTAGNGANSFWALRDIDFEVEPGEVIGIIGHNGAGKSTLLKVLSEITEPTCGEIRVRGRIASLLEVGTGFHPELTGRENIYLNGAILGMTRVEISAKFDEIVAFSGIDKFLDTPVKRYSSGMYVRLAFSVAAHLEPEILVIDEVLAVGDLEFQKRCLGKMGQVARSGRTVLFVSHNMTAVNELCQRCLLLDHGRLVTNGPTSEVIDEYLEKMSSGSDAEAEDTTDKDAWIRDVQLTGSRDADRRGFCMGDDLTVEIHYGVRKTIPQLAFGISIEDSVQNTRVFACLSSTLGQSLENVTEDGCARVTFPALNLVPGRYLVTLTLNAKNYEYDRRTGFRMLDILGNDELGTGWVLSRQRNGVVWLNHEWSLET